MSGAANKLTRKWFKSEFKSENLISFSKIVGTKSYVKIVLAESNVKNVEFKYDFKFGA